MFRRIACPSLVGRESELAQMDGALARASVGDLHPAAVFVSGEAGIGKTRLVHEFAERARAAGVRVWTGRCLPVAESLTPYAPIIDVLRGIMADLGHGELRDLAGAGIDPLWPDLVGASPDRPDHPETAEPPPTDHGHLQAAWWLLLERLAVTPVMIVVEDLHWADPSTRELLAGLVRANHQGRLLLVGTYRDDELPPGHQLHSLLVELDRAGAARVRLSPLSQDETAEQITGILRTAPTAELTTQIFSRSGGNPFLVEELVAAGEHTPPAGDSAGAGDGPMLPEGLRDILLARFRTLPSPVQRILRVLALASHAVEHALLEETVGQSGDELLAALRLAVDRHVLVVAGSGYGFRHALVAEAVAADMLPGERIRLHRALAAALESRVGIEATTTPAAVYAEIAHHWLAAGEVERALPAVVRAGLAARRSLALAEAREHFGRAARVWRQAVHARERSPLDLVEIYRCGAEAAYLMEDAGEGVRLVRQAIAHADPNADPVRVGLLHEQLGRYLSAGGGSAEDMVTAYEEAVRLVPDLPTSARARVLVGLACANASVTRQRESQRWSEQALRVARVAGDRTAERRALSMLGVNLARLGAPDEGLARLAEALAVAERYGTPVEVAGEYTNQTDILLSSGRFAEAADVALRGLREARRHGLPAAILFANALEALLWLGRWDDFAVETANIPVSSYGTVAAEWLRLLQVTLDTARGRFAPAGALLGVVRRVAESSGRVDLRGPFHVARAEFHLWQGDPGAAANAVADGLAAVANSDFDLLRAQLLALGARADADAAALRSRAGGATPSGLIAKLVDAAPPAGDPLTAVHLDLARAELGRMDRGSVDAWAGVAAQWARMEAPYRQAYALWRQADAALTARRSRPAVGRLLRAAHATAVRLGAAPLEAEVAALARRARLDLVGAPVPAEGVVSGPAGWLADSGLTAREADVLTLLGEGRTNRQIARALFISEKTVSSHVSRVLAKLGAPNRVAAAAAAHRAGLSSDSPRSA
jgi:DNA-binding CsgD family transcriptional regulator/tetratricopeptide (TPR) repeat protein